MLGHVTQQSTHDLARACLREIGRQNDLTRLGDRANGARDVLSQLLHEGALIFAGVIGRELEGHKGHNGLTGRVIRGSDYGRFSYCRVRDQCVFDFGR